jgi:hypothetical protein
VKKINKEISILLFMKRERSRLNRLKKKSKHKCNGKYLNRKRIKISIPSDLNLDENRDNFFKLIDQIQDAFLNNKRFLVNHIGIQKITKEALLLLTSEIERCTTIMGIKLRAKSKFLPKK